MSADPTKAVEYVETAKRGRLGDLQALIRLAEDDTWDAANAVGTKQVENLLGISNILDEDPTDIMDRAVEAIDEFPLSVEKTVTFEIVLGTGGPDDRLLVECDLVEMNSAYVEQVGEQFTYEVSRILYRYSWEGRGELVLEGEDREVAEAFARRVVLELAE